MTPYASPIRYVRWSATHRTLDAAEVHSTFAALRDRVLLFAFETDRMVVEPHSGELSVKVVARGAERYVIGGRMVTLEPGRILLTNAGQQYASSIDQRGTRSLSLFLPPHEVVWAQDALRRREAALLDAPGMHGGIPEVAQAPFRPQRPLRQAAERLIVTAFDVRRPELDELQDLARLLAFEALAEAMRIVPPGALASCVRRSTRDELIARVLRARDFVEDRAGHASLQEMAEVACLSKYHFLRAFTEVVGRTPARYAAGIRLNRGRAMLEAGAPGQTAARRAGYQSASALRRALRRNRSV